MSETRPHVREEGVLLARLMKSIWRGRWHGEAERVE